MKRDSDIRDVLGFSEVRISRNIRKVAQVRYTTMVIGIDEAQDYAEFVNNTLNEAKDAHQSLSDVPVTMPCDEVKRTVHKALRKIRQVRDNVKENELKTAATYLEKLKTFLSRTEDMMLRVCILVLSFCLMVSQNGCNAESTVSECRESNETTYAVAAMAEFPAIYETLRDLYSTVTSFPVIVECAKQTSSLNNFEEKVKSQAQTMSSAAAVVDKTVKDAGVKKAHQGEAARQASCAWQQIKVLYHLQQAMLVALDSGIKDTLLKRAEQIGGEIRNQTKEWTIDTVKEELKFEMGDVQAIADALSPSIKDVVGPILTQVIGFNIATQVIAALRKSPLESALETDREVSSRYPFTEFGISEGLRRIASTRHTVLTTGLETADQYSTFADKTVAETETVQTRVNGISITTQCREVETTATEALAKLKELQMNMQQNEAKAAEKAKEEIEGKDADVINSAMFAADNGKGGLKSTMAAVLKTLPEDTKRTDAIQEAASALAMSDVEPSMSVASLGQLLKDVDPKIEKLNKAYICYAKVLEVIGAIVRGCRSGLANFDGVYQQATSQANVDNDQCSKDAMIQLPSKSDIQSTVQKAAAALNFNPDCSSNRQRDRPSKAKKLRLRFQDEDAFFGAILSKIFKVILSRPWETKGLDTQQKLNVCQHKKHSMSDKEIADKLGVKEKLVKDVECTEMMTRREREAARKKGEL